MKNILLIVFSSMLIMSCQDNSTTTTKTNLSIPPPQEVPLNVTLNMTQTSYQLGQPITLRFVLKNNTPEIVTFCKLNSPANGQHFNNCFKINDAAGHNVPFIGTIHDNPEEHKNFIPIEGNGIKLYTIDIRPVYKLDQVGTYTIRFIGDNVNLLANSLPARFVIK